MGQIKDQAIKGTIYAYFGIGIGFVIAAVLFPEFLTTEQIGLLGLLVSYSMIFAQFGSLGINMVTIKYFPLFRNKELHHHGFFSLLFTGSFLGFILTIIAFFIFNSFFIQDSSSQSTLFKEYIYFLIPLIFCTLFFNLFDNYLRALHNTVFGTIQKEVVQRVLILIALALLITKIINFKVFVIFYVISFGLPMLFMFAIIFIKGEVNFKVEKAFLSRSLLIQMISVALFGIIGGFTSMVISNLDRILLERYFGLSEVGIYITVYYFASMVSIPSRSLIKIVSPHVSDALKNKDRRKLIDIYVKSSINQLIIGLIILILIWANIENIIHFLPEKYAIGKYVILFAGMAFLLDMASGSASDIIANSSHYKVTSYLLIFLVLLVIITCIIFIPIYGMTGAALAICISKLINNIARYIFVKKTYNLDPYDYTFLFVIGVGLLSYAINLIIPEFNNIYTDGIIRSTIITLVYILLIYILKVSSDFNHSLNKLGNLVLHFFKK